MECGLEESMVALLCVQVMALERVRKEGNRLEVDRFEGGKRLGKEAIKRLIWTYC